MEPEAIKEFNLSIVGIKKSQMAHTLEQLPENVKKPKQMSAQIKESLGWVDWGSKARLLNCRLREVYRDLVLMIAAEKFDKERLVAQEKRLNDVMEIIAFHL